ncbi:hypothetical protein [Mesorhizobium sp. B4-1-4]|uniref:hypothetical protein n=1 Tax=Mesorhizobium sp. B4-1-4 TaxID=2589888 RepID=UPI001D00F6ED|nr:hypothetical protein [Mesorhizobium sp. B4-1-4]UCI31814.1 hypothetical protein FJW03_29375 [Mesorhizobium sp. B4-1-4]
MAAANPVDQQLDLGGFIVDIGDLFLNDGANDALLEPGVRRWRRPDSLKVCGQRRDARCQHRGWPRRRGIMRCDLALDLTDTDECLVPTRFQVRRDQPVLGIGRVVLPEDPVGSVAGSLKIPT